MITETVENPVKPRKSKIKDPHVRLPAYFDKNPELKQRTLEVLQQVSPEEKEKNYKLFKKYVEGEMSWAEIKQMPRRMLKEIARYGYQKFQLRQFDKAEIIFKGLAILDHLNWYYRAALGAILQKQGLYESAIHEYTMALKLKENEVTALANRGECQLRLGHNDAALKDFEQVLKLGLPENNNWVKRCRLISQKISAGEKIVGVGFKPTHEDQ
jgi:tetratricopeptide (TPR) repeat protein